MLKTTNVLSRSELKSEIFLNKFVKAFNLKYGKDAKTQQEKVDKANKELASISIILAQKFAPHMKQLITIQEEEKTSNLYCEINAAPQNPLNNASNYRKCFDAYVNSSNCVSFTASNVDLLGRLDIKDVFILTFFAMLTNRRKPYDNLLQLICSGLTSSGKTTLFESPLQAVSKKLATGEEGIGRFVHNNKSVLLLHDCDISILYSGKDKNKFKAIARTEPVEAKVHLTTVIIPPLFVFVTSNDHLMNHCFEPSLGKFKRNVYLSKPDEIKAKILTEQEAGAKTGKKKKIKLDYNVHELKAVRSRYIEMFVRVRPTLPKECLLKNGAFTRENAIQGLYSLIVSIIKKYERIDYNSAYLFLYAIAGLCTNIILMKTEYHNAIVIFIFDTINRLLLEDDEKDQLIKMLLKNVDKANK